MQTRTLALPLVAVVTLLGSCKADKTQPPDLVERSAVYTLEDGRVVRIPTYRSEYPVLGQCVESLTYALSAGSCAKSAENDLFTASPEIPVRMLDKQGFRAFSRQLSVESTLDVNASGQKVSAKAVVAKHRLFIEWNRYAVYSIDPFTLAVADEKDATPYVSGVEYGIGVRVILDVTLTDVDANANLSFGFGSIGANVATKKAQIAVQYDTIGVSRDILPENLPMAIESVGDLTKMLMGLYGAVENISDRWNERVENQKLGDIKIHTVSAPWLGDMSTQPDGRGDSIDSDGAAPVVVGDLTSDLPSEPIKDLVDDVNGARAALQQSSDPKLTSLYRKDTNNKPSPIIGGVNFEALVTKVNNKERVSVEEVQSLFDSIAEHADALEKLPPGDRASLRGLPEQFRTAARTHLTLNEYYPALRGDEDELFPRGFSAAPIAYYVMRTPYDIERDYCDTLQLNYASRQQAPSSRALERCLVHWQVAADIKFTLDIQQAKEDEAKRCYRKAEWLSRWAKKPKEKWETKCRAGYWDPAGLLPLDKGADTDDTGTDDTGTDGTGTDGTDAAETDDAGGGTEESGSSETG